MCCALAALMLAVVAAWRAVAGRAAGWRRSVRWAAALAAGALLAAGGSAVAAMVLDGPAAPAHGGPLQLFTSHICRVR